MSEKFDIYSKIFFRDVGNFVRYLCVLVLRHQMRVSNYFVNSSYSVAHRVHTERQRPLSGVHFIRMEKLAQAGDGGGARTPLYLPSKYKVAGYDPAERA